MTEGRLRVLLVEDNPADADLIRELLLEADPGAIELEHVNRLSPAVEKARTNHLDAVMLDLSLPDSQGLPTLLELRAAGPDLPIVVLTGLNDEFVAVRAVQEGAQDYLVKGQVEGHGLVRAVRYAIERKRVEQKLRESERRFFQLLEGLPVGVFVVDADGHPYYANAAAQRLLGRGVKTEARLDELPSLYQFYVSGSDVEYPLERTPFFRALKGERAFVDDIEIRHPDRVIPVEVWSSPISSDDGRVAFAITAFQDVTERREAQRALKESEERLRQSQKMEAIGHLAGGIAHDFNNLLTAIGGFGHLLMARPDSSDRAEWAEQIVRASEHAATLVAQLLAFSRQQVIQPQVLSLNAVIADTEKLLARLLGEDVEIISVLEPDLGPVTADRGQIGQVLLNLATNARDAMPMGGQLTIETANVEVTAEEARENDLPGPGPYVTLAVSDTGTGMDEETLRRIFEPFFTTKEPGRGTGLGLATVYGIVRQTGGAIRVASQLGRGTTFTIFLPGLQEEESATPSAEFVLPLVGGSETVLVVEDEPGVRRLATSVLGSLGYTVLEAASGTEALEVCQGHEGPVDLVLTDMVMAGLSGVELAEQLAVRYPRARVLLTSGYARDGSGTREVGVDYLAKPFTPDALGRKVREVLDAE